MSPGISKIPTINIVKILIGIKISIPTAILSKTYRIKGAKTKDLK